MSNYRAKRIERGRYLYRGYEIEWVGYIDKRHPNAWQAKGHDGVSCFAQSGSLTETKMYIDDLLDNNSNNNETTEIHQD